MTIEKILRNYQLKICQEIQQKMQTHRSVMVQMPTGTGKTLVLAAVVQHVLNASRDARVLLVAHRTQLVEQLTDTVHRVLGGTAEGQALLQRVEVRSIQWLTRQASCLQQVPQLVVIDEAHHALAATYRILWQQWPGARFLGCTATPCRLNGEGFTDLFEVLVRSYSIRRFIAEGWLSGFVYYSIRPDSEEQGIIDGLQKRGADGDYQTKEMREKLDRMPTLGRLYGAYRRWADGCKALVYAIDIAHAEHIAAYFRAQGVAAEALSSKTPAGVRRERLEQLRAGSLQVLVNVDLFSEGFDCPEVACILLARPTLSLARYLQMVGRGLRPHRGKEPCVLLDLVGLYRVFGLPSAERDWTGFFEGRYRSLRGAVGRGKGLPGGRIPPAVLEASDEEVVRIAACDRADGPEGAEADEEVPSWLSGRAQVLDWGGIRLATDDGRMFYPCIRSPWLHARTGIHRKLLQTEPYAGLSWQRLYIPYQWPHRLFQLVKVWPHQARLYRDEQGRQFVQQDLDGALQEVPDEAWLADFLQRCRGEAEREAARCELRYRNKVMNPGEEVPRGAFPPGTRFFEEADHLCRVEVPAADGRQVCWLDRLTGFVHREQPVGFRRSFVQLLREGNRVFIRNIRAEAGVPHRNCEVRADERFCTVGSRLYVAGHLDGEPGRIRRKSEDFRMFVIEEPDFDPRCGRAPVDRVIMNEEENT